ncbi:glycoside hydrolase family 13 protein [Arthrobacter sp. KFRI-F3372]|uniref:Alpha-glucosidase n=1 Tax=Pseudarthrobacter oxydans TaxID=1671 RepID=A0AAW8N8L9_PSEOX|nr:MULTISPECIES: glycoside hydrolase family 13 protein [Pseudarthrobacter]WHP59765.1 glycoside hydrolase family 13 protein [Arthrobacter sp. KFRI-F3372]MDR6791780.1 alpha-glucosidase [Pseudarthrobacter oxydans]MDR7163194.1 alpha-glucosidase [Pseudarthrobacter oxydans]NSX36932.1 alpha-amylase [Pseudarthrobacter oxydans]GKV71405.1 alpha-glucosidase [Pseudarthrobacter sp. NCCP-2145]
MTNTLTLDESDVSALRLVPVHPADHGTEWWRSSVIYQIYPRSFRDLNGDGQGDLPGITAELHQLAALDVDAVWLSPFYVSPQRDGGYDVADYCDVDPVFGTLADFDALVARADSLGIRVIIDLVPNHCSSDHALFQAALQAGPGSPERDMFIFRDGRGESGELPPNNWQSHFGGPAWTRITEPSGEPGQWYVHLFDSSQPDFNWDNPAVHAEFERVLRFWLQRGVAGFRVDVAHALVKAAGLPDWHGRPDGISTDDFPGNLAPMFGQPEIHDIYRRWREVLAEFDGDRILCAEASIDPLSRLTNWVLPDQMHQAFNFAYLGTPWDAARLRAVIESSLRMFDSVGAPTTWVLSNHDVVRHATRFGIVEPAARPGDGLGAEDVQPDAELGLQRAAAASMLMLALPGGVYLYQGEELGLPDHTTMDHTFRQDPSFKRTAGERIGRDGCRVPLPWEAAAPAFGFNSTGESWLPQPEEWAALSRDVQDRDGSSVLSLYRRALGLRRAMKLGAGSLDWLEGSSAPDCVTFVNNGVLVMMNMGDAPVDLPGLEILLSTDGDAAAQRKLGPAQCIWLRMGPSGTSEGQWQESGM